MSAPPVKRSLFNCRQKIRYADEFAARAVASIMAETYPRDYQTKKIGVYKCPHCAGFHISTTSVFGDREVTAEAMFPTTARRMSA